MRYTSAAVALFVATQAYATTVSKAPTSIFARQAPGDFLDAVPEACAEQCAPLATIQTSCAEATTEAAIRECVCTDTNLNALTECTTCALREIQAAAEGSGIDPEVIQTAIDTGREAFQAVCEGNAPGSTDDEEDEGNAGDNDEEDAAAPGPSSTNPPPAEGTSASGSSASQTPAAGNSGFKVEVAGGALAVALGALLL